MPARSRSDHAAAASGVRPFGLYERGLLAGASASLVVRSSDGSGIPLALERFTGAADATDRALLAGITGPVLDVGCGPGRHLHALAQRGVFALGVDLSQVAVTLARDRGVTAITGSVFDDLPGARTWRTALLLDGNVGIGGRPQRLLARLHALLADDGEVLAELSPPGSRSGPLLVRLESGDVASAWFPWAHVTRDDIGVLAQCCGFSLLETTVLESRSFARLRRQPAPPLGCSPGGLPSGLPAG